MGSPGSTTLPDVDERLVERAVKRLTEELSCESKVQCIAIFIGHSPSDYKGEGHSISISVVGAARSEIGKTTLETMQEAMMEAPATRDANARGLNDGPEYQEFDFGDDGHNDALANLARWLDGKNLH